MSDVAELMVRCLEDEGVTHVFGIPGEENILFVDALSRSKIRYVLVRHEQAASFMAETYGRLTGRPGVCSATLDQGRSTCCSGSPTPRPTRRPWWRFGTGRQKSELQRVSPERRSRLHVRSGDQMVGAGGNP